MSYRMLVVAHSNVCMNFENWVQGIVSGSIISLLDLARNVSTHIEFKPNEQLHDWLDTGCPSVFKSASMKPFLELCKYAHDHDLPHKKVYGRANEKRHAHALIAIGPCDEQKIETLISKFQLQEDGLHEVKLRWNQNPEEQLEEKLSEVWPYMPDIIDFARVTIIKRIEASNTIGIITNEYIDNMTVDVVSSMCKKYIQDYLTGKRHE